MNLFFFFYPELICISESYALIMLGITEGGAGKHIPDNITLRHRTLSNNGRNCRSNLNWIFIFSLIIWQLLINPTALSWISKNVYWTINCQQSHTKWNVHFKWLLSSVYWKFQHITEPNFYALYYIILLSWVTKIV